MDYLKYMSEVEYIISKMNDDISVDLYRARIEYLVNRDFYSYIDKVIRHVTTWNIEDLDALNNLSKISEIVIFGCGNEGRYIRKLVACSNYSDIDVLFCDNNRHLWGATIDVSITEKWTVSTKVISPEELRTNHYNSVLIVGTSAHIESIRSQLQNMLREDSWRIISPKAIFGNHLNARTGLPYFDMFSANDNEIFIDAGALDGTTSIEFAKWAGNYEEIYVLEPNPKSYEVCLRNLQNMNLKNYQMVPKGAWSREEILNFHSPDGVHQGGARIVNNETGVTVSVDSIDNICNERATFIKMDIEGSEYQALIGASETIKKCRPRMAISAYHKPEDILTLPSLINHIRDDYRFTLRQYSSNMYGLVLYVF